MKFKVGDRVKFISSIKYGGVTIGKTYIVSTADPISGEYYIYNDNGMYDLWSSTTFERDFEIEQPNFPNWNPYSPIYASDYESKEVKKCTCGCASLEITEIDRHSSYCDLKSNPKIGNWKWT